MINPGDKVYLKVDPNIIGVVSGVLPSVKGMRRYKVFHGPNKTSVYYENQIELIIENEQNNLMNLNRFISCYIAKKLNLNPTSSLFSLNTGNIRFIPFQFRPLARILKAERPRILIADEVGVGKTIETGIIIKEFEKRDNIKKIIIICPKDLTYKWQREMKYKFGEHFTILSSGMLNYCLRETDMDGEWPDNYQKCIVGLEMLRQEDNLNAFNNLEENINFDMVIVDEAHHVMNRNSKSYEIVSYFCENSDIAIFLSATPLQLSSSDLFSLLNLLLPEEFMDESIFNSMAEPNLYINEAIYYIRNSMVEDWENKTLIALNKIENVNSWAKKVFSENSILKYWINRFETGKLSNEERISCIKDLESLHTFSHVLNRTKRKDIGEFTIREPITIRTKYAETEKEFYDAITDFKYNTLALKYGKKTANFIMSTIERQVTSCIPAFVNILDTFLNRGILSLEDFSDDIDADVLDYDFDPNWTAEHIRTLATKLPIKDSKTEKLLELIYDTMNNTNESKLLVFSFFKHTLRYLFNQIRNQGIRVEVITGDTSDEDREDYRNRFRKSKEEKDAIDVLLCSDVGCEGLDYEFCTRMVNYDIPWNPMKIEQRIGRIDRFGQKSPKVQIYNFITEDTVEDKVFYRCYERLGVFNATIGSLEGVLGSIVNELTQTAFDLRLTDEQRKIQALQIADNTIRLANEKKVFEQDSQDLFLLDLDKKDNQVLDEKNTQSFLLKTLILNYLKNNYQDCKVIEDKHCLKVRMYKTDKRNLIKKLYDLIENMEVDAISQEVKAFEKYLLSESQNCILSFAGEYTDEIYNDTVIYVNANHPFVKIASTDDYCNVNNFSSNLLISSSNFYKGIYQYMCCQWSEKGYRKSEDIKIMLQNVETDELMTLSLVEFEQLLINAKTIDEECQLSFETLEGYIFTEQQKSKERLEQINADIVNKKLATMDRYYSKKISKYERQSEEAKNKKMKIMYNAMCEKEIMKHNNKREELQQQLNADIFVDVFAQGLIEVR